MQFQTIKLWKFAYSKQHLMSKNIDFYAEVVSSDWHLQSFNHSLIEFNIKAYWPDT